MLEYQNLRLHHVRSDTILRLTIYFFSGFLAAMTALACVAFLLITADIAVRVYWSIGIAGGTVATVYSAWRVLQILSVDTDTQGSLDSRLND